MSIPLYPAPHPHELVGIFFSLLISYLLTTTPFLLRPNGLDVIDVPVEEVATLAELDHKIHHSPLHRESIHQNIANRSGLCSMLDRSLALCRQQAP